MTTQYRHNLSPRGDGNLGDFAFRHKSNRHNLSPRGDGNFRRTGSRPFRLDTTYPREGTETTVAIANPPFYAGHNLSPRGDGNIIFSGFSCLFVGHNLSPRGDGNPEGVMMCQLQNGHNLSPRGDGNLHRSISFCSVSPTQLIPARGRKRKIRARRSGPLPDTTYPREGTETRRDLMGSIFAARHNLSPRGDGNITKETEKPLCMDTTYPREGTETYFCFALLSLLSNLTQLIPARGRKRVFLCEGGNALGDTTYPREGTETDPQKGRRR